MAPSATDARASTRRRHSRGDSPVTRWFLTGGALLFLGLFLVLPLVVVFANALEKGMAAYLAAFSEPDALADVRVVPPGLDPFDLGVDLVAVPVVVDHLDQRAG